MKSKIYNKIILFKWYNLYYIKLILQPEKKKRSVFRTIKNRSTRQKVIKVLEKLKLNKKKESYKVKKEIIDIKEKDLNELNE